MKNIKFLLIIFIVISLSLSGCFLIDSIIPSTNDNSSVSESNGSESAENSNNSASNDTNSGSTTTANVDEIIASGDYVKQEVLVKVTPTADLSEIAETINGEIIEFLTEIFVVRILLPASLDIKEAIIILNQNKSVQYAEPNGICTIHLSPNDTYYDNQWAPQLTNLEGAWAITKGDGVIIAITDTGVDGTHEDLTGRVIAGRDTYNNLDISPGANSAIHPHGTHCAGIAAAAGDNSAGIAGVAWESDIMPIRMSMDEYPNNATWVDMAEAFMWAANNSADIISCSFGGKFYSQVMKDAVDYAVGFGCTMFASMGNTYTNEIQYPAGYQSVIAVGATNAHDEIANFSTTGNHMSICAPGVEIYSTVPGNSYSYMSGTSMACPFAAGVAALMLSYDSSLSQYDIKTRLENSAVDLGSEGFNSTFGYGRVDALAAINNEDISDYGSIKVLITDSNDEPLSGVSLILWNGEITVSTTNSNNDGEAMFEYIHSGDYSISASLNCFEPSLAVDNPVTVVAGNEVSITITFSTALEIKPGIANVEGIAITRKLDESSSANSINMNLQRFEDRIAMLVENSILKANVNYNNASDILLSKDIDNIGYLIQISWPAYQDAKGYLIYRSINDSEYVQILNWEYPYSGEEWLGFYDSVASPDSRTYKYYLIVYGDCWHTEQSNIITVDSFLPPCSLVSPENESTITEPTPEFAWNPVGLSDFPSGSIVRGDSDLWVYDITSKSGAWWCYFDDMTTPNITYNVDGSAASLVSGHNYIWESWGYGFDEDGYLIAMSWSENWDFTVDIEGSSVGRALLVGVGDYVNFGTEGDLLAPPFDVDMMRDTLEHSGVEPNLISELKDQQATKNAIIGGIASTFSDADSDDVSYFYFSGHGALDVHEGVSYLCPTDYNMNPNTAISVNELETALSNIPGTKVIFIDSCHSGGFIGRELDQKSMSDYLQDYNNSIINAFMSKDFTEKDLAKPQYQILTSCHSTQYCLEVQPETGDPFGLFSRVLCDGCGYDYYTHPYNADLNANGEITLNEAYLYTDWVISNLDVAQDTQVYPISSNFVIIKEPADL